MSRAPCLYFKPPPPALTLILHPHTVFTCSSPTGSQWCSQGGSSIWGFQWILPHPPALPHIKIRKRPWKHNVLSRGLSVRTQCATIDSFVTTNSWLIFCMFGNFTRTISVWLSRASTLFTSWQFQCCYFRHLIDLFTQARLYVCRNIFSKIIHKFHGGCHCTPKCLFSAKTD